MAIPCPLLHLPYIYQPLPPPWSYPETLIHILLIRISCIIENREREEERAKEEPDLLDLPRICTSTDLIHPCVISRCFNYYS
jgi:hypothetical protein